MDAGKKSEPSATPSQATPGEGAGAPLLTIDSPLLREVQLDLRASFGAASLSVAELLALRAGSVMKLEAKLTELIEIHLNDVLVARGELVSVDDNFGVRIVEIVSPP